MISVELTQKGFWDNDVEGYAFLMQEGLELSSDLSTLDKIEQEFYPNLKVILKKHKFNGKKGELFVLSAMRNDKLIQLMFAGVGKLDKKWDRNIETVRRALGSVVQNMKRLVVGSAVVGLPDPEPFKVGDAELLKQLTILAHMADYEFNKFKGKTGKDEERLWITGYRAVVVDAEGSSPLSQEFMCHSNTELPRVQHKDYPSWASDFAGVRLFTLSQGQKQIRFPEGFGIPILAHDELSLTSQVMHLNAKDKESPFSLRHEVMLEYMRSSDFKNPPKPLFSTTFRTSIL